MQAGAGGAMAGTVWLPGLGGATNVPTQSIEERKFDQVIRQQYDFSCGSASLATLLTYHYEDPIDEMTAFNAMYEIGDQAKIAEAGFSLLDMKRYLATRGYESDGYEASLETLSGAGIPAIALINYRGYNHFVVVKGISDDNVLVGDPSLGTRLVPVPEFEDMWANGVLFIIRNRADVAKRYFNTGRQWQDVARAPTIGNTSLSNDALAQLTVTLPYIGDF
jgi:predicted double-glycine peptidase